jgi:hypothetical protein
MDILSNLRDNIAYYEKVLADSDASDFEFIRAREQAYVCKAILTSLERLPKNT